MKNLFHIFLFANFLFIGSAKAQVFKTLQYGTETKSLASLNRIDFFSASIDSLAKDTVRTRKKISWNSPGMVALQSALVPGLGQISNGKWHIAKVPVIYAGFAVCGYFIAYNNREYQDFRKAYRYRIDENPSTVDKYPLYTTSTLLSYREAFRQDRDLTIVITFAVYAANILDAYVFAHLKDFDVSDDLSLHIKPVTFSNIAGRNHLTTGLQLKFK